MAVPLPEYKWKMLRRVGGRFGLDTLVETGGHRGGTVEYLKNDFRRLVTIELGPVLFDEIVARRIPNCLCLRGDSAKVLPQLLLFLDGPALFWLDAHYSGGETAVSVSPLQSELWAILGRGCLQDVVLVDDVDGENTERERIAWIVGQYPAYQVTFHGSFPACVAMITAKG